MDEPSNIVMTLRLTLIFILGLICPQLLAVAGYLWSKNKSKILKAFTLLVAPLTFFAISNFYWRSQAETIRETGHYACGAFGAAAVFSTIYGTILHFILGSLIYLTMAYVWKKGKNKINPLPTH